MAEGIKNVNGEMLYDELIPPDAFGHKKLAGAVGKYVRQQLEKRLKSDPAVKEFMQKTGMFAPDVYEAPEVREVTPGHLVRAGHSSARDVNFGYKAGAAAVFLLLEGRTGNTVVNVVGNKIYCQGDVSATSCLSFRVSFLRVNRFKALASNLIRIISVAFFHELHKEDSKMKKTTIVFMILLAMFLTIPWFSYAGHGHNGHTRVFIGGSFWFGPPAYWGPPAWGPRGYYGAPVFYGPRGDRFATSMVCPTAAGVCPARADRV